MEIEYSELDGGIRLIRLNGELDLNGTYSIEVQFVRYCEGDHARVLVDLSGVSHIASVGIPMLVNTAKSVVERGGKFVLAGAQENVANVLELVGIPQMVPIYPDLESAKMGLSSP
ncbi:MAG: anti-anti-sigma factor [Anaerolineales bacterium]|nr:MAG: anti-anti-sigma factor [Anaerolineales bacterium]